MKAAFALHYPGFAPEELARATATKRAVANEMTKCRYLHFSTHGFFAPPQSNRPWPALVARNWLASGALLTRQDVSGYHPDLLSGLVLAGANRPAVEGQEDGILTALEVSGLDLGRVDLATLSACETGLGESAGGEDCWVYSGLFSLPAPRRWWRACGNFRQGDTNAHAHF